MEKKWWLLIISTFVVGVWVFVVLNITGFSVIVDDPASGGAQFPGSFVGDSKDDDPGSGLNDKDDNSGAESDGGVPVYGICTSGGTCEIFEGVGDSNCATDSNCFHTKCDSDIGICVLLSGPGISEDCNAGTTCDIISGEMHSICVDNTCTNVDITRSGTSCNLDVDCGAVLDDNNGGSGGSSGSGGGPSGLDEGGVDPPEEAGEEAIYFCTNSGDCAIRFGVRPEGYSVPDCCSDVDDGKLSPGNGDNAIKASPSGERSLRDIILGGLLRILGVAG